MPIRVLLADDQALVRAGIRLVLAEAGDIEVVAEAGDGAAAVELAGRHRVDVALIDIRMPGVDGLTAVERLAVHAPSVRAVMLTTFGEEEYVDRALLAGAAGFLLKDTGPEDLIRAVRVAAAGDAVLSPPITRGVIEQYVRGGGARAVRARRLVDQLSGREREVLVLIGRGMSNAEAGRVLLLSEGTVKTHVRRILTKLACDNRVQAAILAQEAGLLPT